MNDKNHMPGFSIRYQIPVLWILAVMVYIYFNINIHMHESYVYSGSLEGYFDITEGHLQSSPWLLNYKNYGIYHPNHPLLHLLAYVLKSFLILFNVKLSAISSVVLINTIAGIAGAYVFYRIILLFTQEKLLSIFISFILMFSDMYWFLSKSGEAYVSGQLFNLLSVYFLFRYLREKKLKFVIYQAICLGISMAFHSLFVFMLIPQVYLFYKAVGNLRSKEFLKIAGVIFAIIFLFGMAFYILPMHYHLGAGSFSEMVKIFLMYGDEMGVWTQRSTGAMSYISQVLILPFFSGILHFSWGALDGTGIISIILRSLFIMLFIAAFFKGIKNKSIENHFMLIWLSLYFFFTCYILFLPYDMTYWIFILPPFVFILFSFLLGFKKRLLIVIGIALVFFINNFTTDILPKHLVNPDRYFQIGSIENQIKDIKKLGIVIFDTHAETSYLNYYGIIWAIKNSPLFDDVKIEIIIDNNKLSQKIEALSEDNKGFYILKNHTGHKRSLEQLNNEVSTRHYIKTKTTILTFKYDPELDKTSEFQHETSWYDLGPLGRSWNMELDHYEKVRTK